MKYWSFLSVLFFMVYWSFLSVLCFYGVLKFSVRSVFFMVHWSFPVVLWKWTIMNNTLMFPVSLIPFFHSCHVKGIRIRIDPNWWIRILKGTVSRDFRKFCLLKRFDLGPIWTCETVFACSYGPRWSFLIKKVSKISWHCPFKSHMRKFKITERIIIFLIYWFFAWLFFWSYIFLTEIKFVNKISKVF